MSVYSMMYMGIGPFGAMAAGFAADNFGARLTILGGALLCLVASGFFALQVPAIRPMARKLVHDQRAINEVPVTEVLDPAGAPQ
jgi:hypothetical protein